MITEKELRERIALLDKTLKNQSVMDAPYLEGLRAGYEDVLEEKQPRKVKGGKHANSKI